MSFFRKLFRRSADTPPVEAEPAPSTIAAVATPASISPAATTEAPDLSAAVTLPRASDDLLLDDEPARYGTAPLELGSTRELQATAPAIAVTTSERGLAAWAVRDLGRVRRNNQDSVLAMLMSLPQGEHDLPVGIFVVADGMGGHEGGEIASRRAIETIMVDVLEQLALPMMADEEPGATLQLLMVSAVQHANTRIWEESQAQGSDMGTTCTAALLINNTVYLAHVGDSRAYIASDGVIRQITTDHSAVGRLIAMGQLPPDATRTHPNRNQLYRTVGQHPEVQVDFDYHMLDGASHLVLCSDGLWGMVEDDEMAVILAESPWPQDSAQRLIARANLAGGDDNISVVVVSLPAMKGGRA